MTDEQEIDLILIDSIPGVEGQYRVGFGGVTRIEAYEENGPYCMIPYVRVWKGNEKLAEFCKHNIVGVGYATAKQVPA